MLAAGDIADRYREVTAAEKARLEAAAEAARAEGAGRRTAQTQLYEAAGAVFNDRTGYYELNGLADLTEQDMREAYALYGQTQTSPPFENLFRNNYKVRTLFPVFHGRQGGRTSASGMFMNCRKLEAVAFAGTDYSSVVGMFGYSTVKAIYGLAVSAEATTTYDRHTFNCSRLEHLELKNLRDSVTFELAPKLSLWSVDYIVENAANPQPISITLHPNTYAQLTEELIDKAAGKQISFIEYAAT